MIYIYKDRIIRLEWTILKGTSNVKEDFSRALVKLFLIGPADKYLLDATAENGIITAMVPEGLPEGNYSVEVIYAKNWGNLRRGDAPCVPPTAIDPKREPNPIDERFNDRCLMRSRKDDLFGITQYVREADNVGEGEVVVTLKTSVATYGYDGLSAYELAVLRSDFRGSETMFVSLINKHVTEYFSQYINSIHLEWKESAYLTRIQVIPEMRRKGLMLYYVNGEGKSITEKCVYDVDTSDYMWGLDTSWQSVEDIMLGGALYVSPQGTWVIDGLDSGIKAVGPKGDNGVSPYLTIGENGYIQYSYDKVTWFDLLPVKDITPDVGVGEVKTLAGGSKATVTKGGTNVNPLLNFGIPMGVQGAKGEKGDGWQAKGFVDSVDDLPTSGAIGDTYIVGSAAPYAVYMYKNSVSGFVNMGSVTEVKASIFDGGRADTVYGGAREINCGGADAYLI